jgi:hypothetical protein
MLNKIQFVGNYKQYKLKKATFDMLIIFNCEPFLAKLDFHDV